MRIQLGLALAIVSAVLVGSAVGQEDPIAARQAIMKSNNTTAREIFNMVMGKTPYDPAIAAEQANKLATDMDKFVTLFPEGSDQGDTEASSAIWEKMDDFKAIAGKYSADARAAAAAAPNGPEAFATAFNAVGAACQSCHRQYRE